jgi:hypothetical protein
MMLRRRITLFLIAAVIALGLSAMVAPSVKLPPTATHTNAVALGVDPPDPTPVGECPPSCPPPRGGGGI